uniref:Ig-like domain-containing protein n=1 Tax=Chelydra serpentina TaxID=8475 RepID=A0A8C3S5Q8_CHESE
MGHPNYHYQIFFSPIVMTQTPESLTVTPGDKITINCKANIDDDMNWYQQKSGAAPKLLFSEGSSRQTGVPARFSSSGYGTDFTFAISSVEEEDAADYYCQQSDRTPLTVIQTNTKTSLCCTVCSAICSTAVTRRALLSSTALPYSVMRAQ